MVYNEQDYADKKQKILDKFQRKKDVFLNILFSLINVLQTDLKDLRLEHDELVKTEKNSKKENKDGV